ncbi:hypothetical protein C0Q70_01351 [Pomacea canaliculata]|uniref:C2H2-type domain-containing protein n=1 Tax=Pomacea canaliculata TaxID=400727 RepID=A0A2T7PZ95_POMCA|nr:hypothetical protein C0Q70_01351 [Pomacea canaliculata]
MVFPAPNGFLHKKEGRFIEMLDAKKSPLALLAQTCSSIGKDPTPSKPIIPPLDKKEKEASDKVDESLKRPSSRGSKSSGESGRDSKPGFRTIPPKDIPPLVPVGTGTEKGSTASNSDNGCVGGSGGKSHSGDSVSHGLISTSSHSILSSSSSTANSVRPLSVTGSSNQRSASRSGSARDGNNDYGDTPSSVVSGTRHSASASPPSSVMSKHAPPAHSSLPSIPKPSVTHPSLLPGLTSAHHLAAYPHLSLMPGLALDPAVQSYHNALAAHSSFNSLSAAAAAAAAAQSSVLKAGGGGSALSPYVAYARVRTPSGATTLVPVCRDPYCTNCQLTLQNSHLSSTCNAPGCSQCAHEKSLMSLTSGGLSGLGSASLLPPISSAGSLSSSVTGLSSLHSLYPLAAHQGLPFVCSWMVGNDYCGKRFTSSDELLQHLRTHTSGVEASSLTASYGVLGLHPSLAAAGCHSHYAGSPLSPNSLRRSYPTSLSPVSSLLSASRYHPYKSPLGVVPPPVPTSQALPMGYYSPYSLYSQRLGAAAVP